MINPETVPELQAKADQVQASVAAMVETFRGETYEPEQAFACLEALAILAVHGRIVVAGAHPDPYMVVVRWKVDGDD